MYPYDLAGMDLGIIRYFLSIVQIVVFRNTVANSIMVGQSSFARTFIEKMYAIYTLHCSSSMDTPLSL